MLKILINKLLERLFGLRIYSVNAHGREDCVDIQTTNLPIEVVIDAGANVGQSVKKFRTAFPLSDIYSFEPVSGLYEKLSEATKGDSKTKVFQYALGSKGGREKIYLTSHTTTNTLIPTAGALGTEEIDVITLDSFLDENGLEHIGILKVDVEGFDLEVLKGADRYLTERKIDFVLVEVGFNPGDNRHVLFDHVRDFLTPRGYFLFGVYDQQLEWGGELRLRYANACFARE